MGHLGVLKGHYGKGRKNLSRSHFEMPSKCYVNFNLSNRRIDGVYSEQKRGKVGDRVNYGMVGK